MYKIYEFCYKMREGQKLVTPYTVATVVFKWIFV